MTASYSLLRGAMTVAEFVIDGLDRAKRLGERGEHGLTHGAQLDTSGGPRKQPAPSDLLKLANALTDCARCERQVLRGLLHFSGARHRDKRLRNAKRLIIMRV